MKHRILFNEEGGEGGGGGGTTLLTAPAGQGSPAEASGAAPEGAPSGGQGSPGANSGGFRWTGILAGDDGKFAPDWFKDLPGGLAEREAHWQKYPTIEHVFRDNARMATLLGQRADGVAIPKPDSPPEVVEAFRAALGVPQEATAEAYGIRKPDSLPNGVEWDQAQAESFAAKAHELSLTPQQVKALTDWRLEQEAAAAARYSESMQQAEEAAFREAQKAIEKEWGTKMPEKVALAQRAALTAGYTLEQINSEPIFRNPNVARMLATLGERLGEDKLVQVGSSTSGSVGNRQKAMDVIQNPQNPLYARYHAGDEDARAQVHAWLQNG